MHDGMSQRNDISPPNPPRPWPRRRPWLFWSVVAVVLALIAGGIYWLVRPVLVTDGSHVFAPELKGVEGQIEQENDRVEDSKDDYVSIAVMATMDPNPKDDPLDKDYAVRALQGAYQAQRENNMRGAEDHRPLQVKLLLADDGSKEQYALDTAKELEDRVDSDHLVAVTGLGISEKETQQAIRELDHHDIPMVGADLSGDEYGNTGSYVRIAPGNVGQNRAAVDFLTSKHGGLGKKTPLRVWLVRDKNRRDQYNRSLARSFKKVAGKNIHIAPGAPVFDSRYHSANAAAHEIGATTCPPDNVDVVYFAGRARDFRAFVGGLKDRSCTDHLDVITGVDAAQLVNNDKGWLQANNTDIYYTGMAYPRAMKKSGLPSKSAEKYFINGYEKNFGDERGLDDGWATMYHDAVLTAESATLKAYGHGRARPIPQAGDVAGQMPIVEVPGASGYICFSESDVRNKPVPIIHLTADGHPSLKYVSSTSGSKPQNNPCPQRH